MCHGAARGRARSWQCARRPHSGSRRRGRSHFSTLLFHLLSVALFYYYESNPISVLLKNIAMLQAHLKRRLLIQEADGTFQKRYLSEQMASHMNSLRLSDERADPLPAIMHEDAPAGAAILYHPSLTRTHVMFRRRACLLDAAGINTAARAARRASPQTRRRRRRPSMSPSTSTSMSTRASGCGSWRWVAAAARSWPAIPHDCWPSATLAKTSTSCSGL